MSERRRHSLIWQYMTAFDNTFAVCDISEKKLSYKKSLTNLKKHITGVHWINITEKLINIVIK